jgi:hypothetical protein
MWVLIALLLVASLGLTDAVPAVVSWLALLKVFAKEGTVAAERMLSVGDMVVQRAEEQEHQDRVKVARTEELVRDLTKRRASAQAQRHAPGTKPVPGHDVPGIEARLLQAKRSLAIARQAAAASKASLAEAQAKLERDYPDPRSRQALRQPSRQRQQHRRPVPARKR